VYLKDQAAMEDYLIQQGIEGAILKVSDGSQIVGEDLARVLEEARSVRSALSVFPTHLPRFVLEQAAIGGVFRRKPNEEGEHGLAGQLLRLPAADAANLVAARLDAIAPDTERGWQGRPAQDGGMVFERTVRGVTETRTIDAAACQSAEARRLASFSDGLKEVYDKPATLERKDKTQMIRGPLELLDVVMAEGEKGLSLQRYKGLGEMNPDQLWETTLDPNARTLLQVKIDHMDEANEIFTTLMGDVVEPRRKFIQDNALSVENLDV